MKKLRTEGKNKLVIAGSCILIIVTIGAVIFSNVSRTEQEKEKVNAVSQTVEEQTNEENKVTEQETTQEEQSKTSVEEGEKLDQSDTWERLDRGGKKKKETEAGQEKKKEKSDSVKKDSENKKDETKEESQEKQEEPKAEKSYIPISEGWKDAKSARGEITLTQKEALDAMVEAWKSGALSDSELKTKIMEYLEEQKILFTEVSVTSQGYALYAKSPDIQLSDGGNYYSFMGTYSTGKQNPDGTEKTIFYNWSVFVF